MQFDCRVRGMKVHSVTSGSFFRGGQGRVEGRGGGRPAGKHRAA